MQEHLRIVSGFYGLLRPLDGIWPYRLELGGKLRFFGQTLYGYWGDAISRALFASAETVVNLSSGEYTKAFTPYLDVYKRQAPGSSCRWRRAISFRCGWAR